MRRATAGRENRNLYESEKPVEQADKHNVVAGGRNVNFWVR
jgi:hypothetical protein